MPVSQRTLPVRPSSGSPLPRGPPVPRPTCPAAGLPPPRPVHRPPLTAGVAHRRLRLRLLRGRPTPDRRVARPSSSASWGGNGPPLTAGVARHASKSLYAPLAPALRCRLGGRLLLAISVRRSQSRAGPTETATRPTARAKQPTPAAQATTASPAPDRSPGALGWRALPVARPPGAAGTLPPAAAPAAAAATASWTARRA
jgi:hypothetical protein